MNRIALTSAATTIIIVLIALLQAQSSRLCHDEGMTCHDMEGSTTCYKNRSDVRRLRCK
jgi:hypothetical protein